MSCKRTVQRTSDASGSSHENEQMRNVRVLLLPSVLVEAKAVTTAFILRHTEVISGQTKWTEDSVTQLVRKRAKNVSPMSQKYTETLREPYLL